MESLVRIHLRDVARTLFPPRPGNAEGRKPSARIELEGPRGVRDALRRHGEWLLEARSGIEPLYTALQAAA